MLVSLHVKNLALIDEVEVEFKEHLNILTGETGAGKSIIIGSINMALGGKASPDFIRAGAEYGLVELVFEIQEPAVFEKMKELELPIEGKQIIVSRKLMKNRSICKINGETVTMGIVRELSGCLLDIHGQHEHQSLLQKQKHLHILDRFAKSEIEIEKEKLKKLYKEWLAAKTELEQKDVSEEERARKLSFMEYEKNEIEQARLCKGEDEELAVVYKRLSNAQWIMEGIQETYQITGGGISSVRDEIGRATKQLCRISDYDSKIENFLSELQNIEELLNDFNYQVQEYASSLEFNQEQFQEVEERLNMYHSLKVKYGDNIDGILEYAKHLELEIEQYREYDLYLEKLKERIAKKEKSYLACASKISQIRKKNGIILSEKIKHALVDLNFLDVQFEIQILDSDRYSELGIDDVEFLISTNPGEALKPLGKVASGGELSRIMLALKSVLAEQDEIETLIFDEIDVGISGRTAQKVSEKMQLIAKKHQVICITHLPQITAMADEHYRIEKAVEHDKTSTKIYRLSQEESTKELARILGGAKITDTVLESAKEMKELAKKIKS